MSEWRLNEQFNSINFSNIFLCLLQTKILEMKKIGFTFLMMLSINFFGKAQCTYNELLELKGITVNIILSDKDTFYNSAVKSAFNDYWKFCKYKFVSEVYYEQNKKNKDMYFLVKLEEITGGFGYFYLNIQSGGDIVNAKKIARFTILRTNCTFNMQNIVQQWQYEIDLVLNHSDETKGKSLSALESFLEADRKQKIKELKVKTLYILQIDIPDKVTKEKIEKVYPYKFKIVYLDDLTKAIQNKDSDVCYFYPSTKAQVIEAATGISIYHDSSTPYILSLTNLEELAKAIKQSE